MERDLRINWPAVVEEARRRRRRQGLTQRRLAALAEVSAPTVSRFEGVEKNIQLSSALSILGVLGMLDRKMLTFTERIENYDLERDVVLFEGRNGDQRIACAISGEALADHFGARGFGRRQRLAAFHAHRDEIEDQARRKYLAAWLEPDGSVLIRSEDLD